MDVERFRQLPVMGILRGGHLEAVAPLVECVVAAGLECFEITLNSHQPYEMIARLRDVAGERLMVGAGTVLRADEVLQAHAAGATFIVSPVLVEEVAHACRNLGLPFFPGAMTPSEVYAAWQAGATMVKLFPAKSLGPSYVQELKGPFGDIDLLACGGITPESLPQFFAAGAAAVAFGGSVFRADWLAAREFGRIGTEVGRLVRAYRSLADPRRPV